MAARNSRSKGRSLSRKPNDGRKSLPRSSASKKVAKHESISRKSRTSGSKPTSQAKKGATRTAVKKSTNATKSSEKRASRTASKAPKRRSISRKLRGSSTLHPAAPSKKVAIRPVPKKSTRTATSSSKGASSSTSRTSSSATSLSVASSRSSQSIVKPVLNVRLCINLAGNKEVTIDLPNVLNDPRVVSADASSSGRRNSSKPVSVAQKRRVQTRRAQVVAAS
ncbi:hypothetical protein Ddc_02611 [Ditylenchus destructor]|nr:hypothetical protein Ddc_02611 [Ditylenchus destructor]